jgi:hypothetical protein
MYALMIALTVMIQPSPLDVATDAGSGVVLNEFIAHPLASETQAEGEWIELHNVTGCYINLSGWTITNDHGDQIDLNTHLIAPEGFFVLGASGNDNRNGGYEPDFVYSDFTIYVNDALTLRNGQGNVVDRIDFDYSWPIEPGKSTERINPGWVSNSSSSWEGSLSTYGDGDYGTPGEQNSVYENSFAQNSWAFIKAFTL